MKLLYNILAILTGAIFIFSGLVKLIDPIGMGIKLDEYFEVFIHDKQYLYLSIFSFLWYGLKQISLYLGIFLSGAEVVLGVCLITFYAIRRTLWALLILVIFFAFLTFYSAFFDVVKDCGCFGDFIKFTPWGSFIKDMILAVPIIFLFINRRKLQPTLKPKFRFYGFIGAILFSIALPGHALWHLPPFDFRPYAIGKNIPKQMKASKPLKYEEVYYFDNLETGKTERFGPKDDWGGAFKDTKKYKYKDYKKELLNPEDQSKIHDFEVLDETSKNVNERLFKGVKLMILFQKTKDIYFDISYLGKLIDDMKRENIEVFGITSSGKAGFDKLVKKNKLNLTYYSLDEKVVKTVVRSSPGIVLLKDGIVRGKWHYHNTPSKKTVLSRLK